MSLDSSSIMAVSYDRRRLYFSIVDIFLQRKHHIRRSFKIAGLTAPTHAAFAVLQSDKLLLHFSSAIRAGLV